MSTETFPIDLRKLLPLRLNPAVNSLTDEQRAALRQNIQLVRDTIVFFTALAGARGLSGHTGGAFDTVPELMIIRAFIADGAAIVPVFYDEAGHRVATQYLLSVLDGHMPPERLLHYREFDAGLPGHPEKGVTPGVQFSSGRLGHLWAFCNGVAMANPGKSVVLLGSDGSQMEGDDAEAARLAVAQQLNIKVLVDDNNVTIAGHPQEYLPGYDLSRTLSGYGITAETTMGEDLDALYVDLCRAFSDTRPHALIIKRPMAPGIAGAEGSPHAHEVLKADTAIKYLQQRGGYDAAIALIKAAVPDKSPLTFRGSSGVGKNRDDFGKIINGLLDGMTPEQRVASVRVFDCDLEGSCGLHHIRKAHPEVFVRGGIMERGNYSAAAGFGSSAGKQGVIGTFSAFLEMVMSEVTMARLNFSNVLAHFSHSGVDDMADNTCHFGINSMLADGGVDPLHAPDTTRLYFPADQHQFAACVKRIFNDPGLRFVFSTRAAVPDLLDEQGQPLYAGKSFDPQVDTVVREAPAGGGYIVATGETVYRALDAVINLQEQGIKVGLINKAVLNIVDKAMMAKLAVAPFVLFTEGWNVRTGLGGRFGTQLLQVGFKGRYNHLGVYREGCGGLWQQIGYQGLDSPGIQAAVKALA
ncbi:MAG TPA: transketolase C-terminal domain-containing protein [Steroidobacteraceae bacterium]|jgi:transketolase|nr:transketolase C-terminal domain-containing protein [Steroidobacteraceae bacterium]